MTGGADTRERLLQATIELLAGPGMAAVSARGIAARAEVNQGLVFYHFGSVTALVAQATRLSTENTVMLYRAALRHAGSFGELLAVGRRLHAEAASVGSVRVMAQLLAAGQSAPAYADVARQSLDLWFAEVTAAVERLLDASPSATWWTWLASPVRWARRSSVSSSTRAWTATAQPGHSTPSPSSPCCSTCWTTSARSSVACSPHDCAHRRRSLTLPRKSCITARRPPSSR